MILCASLSVNYNLDNPWNNVAERLRVRGFGGIMMGYRNWTMGEVERIRRAFESRGLIIAEIGNYCSIITPDEEKRRANVERCRQAITAAHLLGVRCVATISGSRDPKVHNAVHPDNWSEEAWQTLMDSCHQILEATQGTKVKFCLEPMIRTHLNSPESLRKILDDVNHPNLGIQLDPVNIVNVDTYYRTGDLINHLFDLLGDRIGSAHAKDVYIAPDELVLHVYEVQAGKGNLDYKTFLRRMSELPPDTPLIIEHLKSDDEYAAAADYIRGVAKEVGIVL